MLKAQGFDCHRGQQFHGGNDSPDVVGLTGIHIECKHNERLNIFDAIEQATRDSANSGNIPAVFHRKNNKETLVTMKETDWIELYRAWRNTLND